MIGFGPPVDRKTRRQWWRRQVERQEKSNLTVAEFCRRSALSPVTFYAWKRRFREASPASPLHAERSPARPMQEANGAATPPFLAVSILETGTLGQLEVELANACVVRLKGTVDPELLRIAIRAAGRHGGDRRGGE